MTSEQIEEKIEAWHGLDIQIPLHVYLGWTEEEYRLWVEKGEIPEDK